VQFAIEAHYLQNRPLPRAMQEMVDSEPELEAFEGFYLEAFWKLVTERRGGPCIPYSEIVEYGEREGLDSAMIDPFVSIIWTLDRAQAKWAQDEQERQRKNTHG